MEHVQGNWFHHWSGHYFTIDIGPGEYDPSVAHVYLNHVLHMSKEDAETIARLIAAAPDLLNACKALVGFGDEHEGMTFSDRLKLASEAIDKAEGRS